MHAFSKSMRNRLPALGLGLMAAFGAMGAAAVVLAPVAEAKVNEKMGPLAIEAQKALQSKNFALAAQKTDAAAAFAKTSEEKLIIEQLRFGIAQGKNDYKGMISSGESLISMGAPSAKQIKTALPGWYEKTGNSAKAMELLKANVANGGSANDYYTIGAMAYKGKNYADALKYGTTALQKSGAKPAEKYFELVMSVYKDTNKEADYLATMEKAVVLYPKEDYWNKLFVRIQKDPMYKSDTAKLDVYRIKLAAKVKLTGKERADMASSAQYKGFAGEAISALTPMPTDLGAGDAASAKATLDAANRAKQDDAALAKEEASVIAGGRGPDMVRLAEKYMGYGKNDKAIDLFQKGIAKGIPDTSAADFARVHLGVAQYRAGKKADAQTTWASIKTDTSAKELAHNWTLVAKS